MPNRPVTLTIGQFGVAGREDDDAEFTLVSGVDTVTGVLDLNQTVIPIGSDQTDCRFGIDTSPFSIVGLRPGDTIETECRLTRGDESELQIENKDTQEVSTGTRTP